MALYTFFTPRGRYLFSQTGHQGTRRKKYLHCSFPFLGSSISFSDPLYFPEICMDGSSCLLKLSKCPTDTQANISKINSSFFLTLSFYPKSILISYHHSVPTHSFSTKPKPEAVYQSLPSFSSYIQHLLSYWVMLILFPKCLPYLELVHELATTVQRVGSVSTDVPMISNKLLNSQIAFQKNTYSCLEKTESNNRSQIHRRLNRRIYNMIRCLTLCMGTDVPLSTNAI